MTHVTSYKGSRVPCLSPVDSTAGQGLGSLETPGLTGSGGRASRAKPIPSIRKQKRGGQIASPGTVKWARMVNLRLGQGYGVEDIAIQLGCTVDWVRAHVHVARKNKLLPRILGKGEAE